jgi:hypothetical protein
MKTTKVRKLSGFIFLIAALSLLSTSCTDEGTDLRDEIVGTYNYTVKIYVADGADLIYVGDQGNNYDITGTMKVMKNATDHSAIDFYDGNIVMFQGINVKDAGNAIVFDIPSQEAWIGPGNVQVTGYQYWNVDSSSYHGAFLYEGESVEIAFTARVMDVDTGLVMILTAFRK